MKRRNFLGALGVGAMGLVLPYEPKRIYSFPTRQIALTGELWRFEDVCFFPSWPYTQHEGPLRLPRILFPPVPLRPLIGRGLR